MGKRGLPAQVGTTLCVIAALSAASALSPAWARAAKPKQHFVVILDPGHGGEDTGAKRRHLRKSVFEKDLTLSLALETRKILKAMGIPTMLTRYKDQFVSLDQRTRIANRAAAGAQKSVFVSIHANATDETHISGVETYVFNATNNEAARRLAELENGGRWEQSHGTLDLILADLATTANYADSLDLARSIQASVVTTLNSRQNRVKNRGVRQALFYVLMQTHMPAVLFEPGFLSNPRELSKLLSVRYRQTLAQSLASGIVNWRQKPQTSFSTMASKSLPIQALKTSAIAKP